MFSIGTTSTNNPVPPPQASTAAAASASVQILAQHVAAAASHSSAAPSPASSYLSPASSEISQVAISSVSQLSPPPVNSPSLSGTIAAAAASPSISNPSRDSITIEPSPSEHKTSTAPSPSFAGPVGHNDSSSAAANASAGTNASASAPTPPDGTTPSAGTPSFAGAMPASSSATSSFALASIMSVPVGTVITHSASALVAAPRMFAPSGAMIPTLSAARQATLPPTIPTHPATAADTAAAAAAAPIPTHPSTAAACALQSLKECDGGATPATVGTAAATPTRQSPYASNAHAAAALPPRTTGGASPFIVTFNTAAAHSRDEDGSPTATITPGTITPTMGLSNNPSGPPTPSNAHAQIKSKTGSASSPQTGPD